MQEGNPFYKVTVGVLGIALFIAIQIALLIITVVASVTWKAWWLFPAWAWYLVPLGLPQISFWHFTALFFLVDTLTRHMDIKKDTRPFDWSTAIFGTMLWPMLAWLILRWMR